MSIRDPMCPAHGALLPCGECLRLSGQAFAGNPPALERPRPALPAATILEIIRRIQDALPHGEHSQVAPLYPTWEAATRIFDALRLYFEPPYAGPALPAPEPPVFANERGLSFTLAQLLMEGAKIVSSGRGKLPLASFADDWMHRAHLLADEVLERGPGAALPAEPPANDGTSWDCTECGTNVTGPSVNVPCPHCGAFRMKRRALPAEHAPPDPSK